MLIAPPHPNEIQRLRALHRSRLLDTPPETAFDDIVKLASHICGTPVSLMSLVDESRQWFKARVGLDAQETPREVAFCAHAILSTNGDPLVVNDAAQDSRFSDNPLVTSAPYVRFYAGVPLVTEDGLPLGTLCVIDHQPRQISPEQVAMLRTLADAAVAQIRLRDHARYLVQKHEAELKDLATARTVQRALLPAAKQTIGGLRVSSLHEPVDTLGGDMIALQQTPEGFWLMLADVSGHGVGSCLVSMALGGLFSSLAQNQAANRPGVGAFLTKMEESFHQMMPVELHFATAIVGAWNQQAGELSLLSAGHPPPLYFQPTVGWRELPINGQQPLGLATPQKGLCPDATVVKLAKGDRCLLFTDGLTDHHDVQGNLWDMDHVCAWLNTHREMEGIQLLQGLLDTLEDTCPVRKDDVAMALVEMV